jgi:hypothetical protein
MTPPKNSPITNDNNNTSTIPKEPVKKEVKIGMYQSALFTLPVLSV